MTVAVTGMGIVSAAGATPPATWESLLHLRTGLGPLTLFPSPKWGHLPVGQVPDFDHGGARTAQLAVHAARTAWEQAQHPHGEGVGLVLGTCTGGMLESEQAVQSCLRPDLVEAVPDFGVFRRHTCAAVCDCIAAELGVTGTRQTISNACASGAAAIALACELIEDGAATSVLAGGTDSLTRLTLNGFSSLLLSAEDGCRPFDADRAGMSLGEGAAMLVLERLEDARARGAAVHGVVTGWAVTCDAYHASGPHPEGDGALRAMRQALACAKRAPAEVDYINAHGSGTIDNDRAEARAICRLFGERPPAVSSTKRFFGHTLAAAGAIEAVVCLLALAHAHVPANLGCRTPCEEARFPLPPVTQPAPLAVALSSSLGFGGSNCALVFERPGEGR